VTKKLLEKQLLLANTDKETRLQFAIVICLLMAVSSCIPANFRSIINLSDGWLVPGFLLFFRWTRLCVVCHMTSQFDSTQHLFYFIMTSSSWLLINSEDWTQNCWWSYWLVLFKPRCPSTRWNPAQQSGSNQNYPPCGSYRFTYYQTGNQLHVKQNSRNLRWNKAKHWPRLEIYM
jgi:hypothetical protein